MADGMKTPDVASAATLDSVLGNVTVGGIVRTRRQLMADLSNQLAGTGGLNSRFSLIEADIAELQVSVSASSINILTMGQSNVGNGFADHEWAKPLPENLFMWNGTAGSSPGSMWHPAAYYDMINCGLALGAAIARRFPSKRVNVFNFGKGSQPIAQWLPGAVDNGDSLFDMYARTAPGVAAGLAALPGGGKIDIVQWFQGESYGDATKLANYVADLQSVWGRFAAEPWHPRDVQWLIMAVTYRNADGLVRRQNENFRQFVALDPEFRTFVDTHETAASLWDAALLHLTGPGHELVGGMADRALFQGAGYTRATTPWLTRAKQFTSPGKANDTVLAPDGQLQMYASVQRSACRGTAYIEGKAASGFKFGFTGPAMAQVGGWYEIIKSDGASKTPFSGALPTNVTFDLPTDQLCAVTWEFKFSPSAAGLLSFDWAQKVSGSGTTNVTDASFIEILNTRT